ncbi:AAA family ATPase [Brevundimonas sp. BAL450]|uniref:AAA family ATPase n=1 Tax=Brevundimonas sp. BAL450 TaxID=1708162 RepID=UPI0018CAF11D|nr:AAA family ATPase [Brevundimonas sp. BAL450]MBG7614642.1 AAA family ATPase [Brevundimonas sp. BAL450]
MLNIDRASHPAPACLSDRRSEPGRTALLELFSLDRQTAAQRSVRMSAHAVEDRELYLALVRLFRGRCAFCEAMDDTRPYRFRPSEEAGPSHAAPPEDADRAHLYYAWLVNAWENIYPICHGCAPRDPTVFPVQGKRRRLPAPDELALNLDEPTGSWITAEKDHAVFLDPCGNTDLRRHLAVLPGGRVLGLSSRGDATVRHFNLDRAELRSRRAAAFDRYRRRLMDGPAGERPGDVFNFRALEFGGGWFLLLYQMALKIDGAAGSRPVLSISRIDRYYADRVRRENFRHEFDEAWHDLMERPGQLLEHEASPRPRIDGDAPQPVAFEIRNFKALEAVDVQMPLPLGPGAVFDGDQSSALVVLGENAAGKSTLLEAIALSLVDERTRRELLDDSQAFMLDPRLMGAPDSDGPRHGQVTVRYGTGPESQMAVRPGLPTLGDDDIPRLPVFAYGAFRLFLVGEKQLRRSSPIRSLFDGGYVLPNPEAWLVSIHEKPEFEEVARILKVIFGFDQEGDVIVVKDGVCHLRMRQTRAGLDDLVQDTPLRVVSSGFRSILAMACDVMRGLLRQKDRFSTSLAFSRAIVLIDEIEAHLHPRWKMRIVTALREALPNVTFIMTTHDPLCLRGLSSAEVTVFRRVERREPGRLPVVVEQLEALPDIGSLTVEQILTSDLFQLYSTDGPEIEARFAKAADLIAAEQTGDLISDDDREVLKMARADMRLMIGRGMPVGSTEVERLIQEAVELYLTRRRGGRADALAALRERTRQTIVDALEGL